MTPTHIPTEVIVSSVEAVLSHQHELSESTKDNNTSRVTSTLQSASLPYINLTPDEQKALKWLKRDENIVILPAQTRDGWLLVWTTTTKWTRLLITNRPTKYLNETRQPHCNANITNNCLHWRKPTRSTFDATIDWGVLFRSHPSCIDYQNYTNPNYLCGPQFLSVGPRPTNCLNTELKYWNWLTNLDINYSLLRTYWCHWDNTDTRRPQNSVLWREITVNQYSTLTGSRLYWEHH